MAGGDIIKVSRANGDRTVLIHGEEISDFWLDSASVLSYSKDGDYIYSFNLTTDAVNTYTANNSDLSTDNDSDGGESVQLMALSSLSALQNKFPDGKYWNHVGNSGRSNSVNNQNGYTDKPCPVHGNLEEDSRTCNGFQPGNSQYSWQCMGYAEKCGYDMTGFNPRDNANGWTTYTDSSALNNLKAGDIVRYNNNGHSIYVTAVSGNTVTYTDCNGMGSSKYCIIRWNATIQKTTLKSSFTHLRSAPYNVNPIIPPDPVPVILPDPVPDPNTNKLLNPMIFNKDYYRASRPELRSMNDAELEQHWINHGIYETPATPVFDVKWYKNKYAAELGQFSNEQAIIHFVDHGIHEGRESSELFSLNYYKDNYQDLKNSFGNDNYQYCIHYINHGWAEGRVANRHLNVYFNANGGVCTVNSQPFTVWSTYNTLPTPTRDGYTFLGWYTDSQTGTRIFSGSSTISDSDHTLYAHWMTNTNYLDINGILDGVEINKIRGYATADVYINGVLDAEDVDDYWVAWPPNTSYEIKVKPFPGYEYIGVEGGSLSGKMGTEMIYLKIKINAAKYTVSFDPGLGTVSSANKQVTYGKTYGQLPVPVRAGITYPGIGYREPIFEGWYTKEIGGEKIVDSTVVQTTSNHTLYAHWTEAHPVYTLSYDGNGGTSGTIPSIQYIEEGGKITFPSNFYNAPSGKQFKAWGIDGIEYAPGSSYTVTANTIVTAIWENVPNVNAMLVSVESKSAASGSKVDVAINIANNPGIAMTQFKINYDPALSLESVESGSIFETSELTPGATGSNPYTVMFFSTKGNATRDGELAVLHFRISDNVEEGASLAVSVTGIASDIDENKINIMFTNGSVSIRSVRYGDVNGDGEINGLDVLRLGKYLTGWNVVIDRNAADVNDDGEVNGLDQLRLAKYCAGWPVTLGN